MAKAPLTTPSKPPDRPTAPNTFTVVTRASTPAFASKGILSVTEPRGRFWQWAVFCAVFIPVGACNGGSSGLGARIIPNQLYPLGRLCLWVSKCRGPLGSGIEGPLAPYSPHVPTQAPRASHFL